MSQIKIYVSSFCPYCSKAKQILDSHDLKYVEINIENNEQERMKIYKITKQTSVPQIFSGDKYIGNCDAIELMSKNGTLQKEINEK